MRQGREIAFEPVARQYERLLQNQKLSMVENLTAEHLALSDRSEPEIILYVAGPRSSIDVSNGGSEGEVEKVRAVSLDDYVAESGLGQIAMLFLDVEGSELRVLSGAKQLLSSSPNLILEVNRPNIRDMGLTPDDLYQFLFDRGYSLFYIDDDHFFTLREFMKAEVVLYPVVSDNPAFQERLTIFNIIATCRPEILDQPGIRIMANAPIGGRGNQER